MSDFDLTYLPLHLPGKIFRSPMPFGTYDRAGMLLPAYLEAGVGTVVMLSETEETLRKTGQDLAETYAEHGLEVIHFPIPDYEIPSDQTALYQTIEQVVALARTGEGIAVHCSAGMGRTGMFLALVVRKVLGVSGEDAISWVRDYFPAVETSAQTRIVEDYQPED